MLSGFTCLRFAAGILRRNALFISLVLCGLILPAKMLRAQSASMTGLATDPSGAAIQHARITLTNERTHATWKAASDNNGVYNVPHVPPGIYTLNVDAPGFKHLEKTGIDVSSAQALAFDAHLQLGSASQSVTVNGENDGNIATVGSRIPLTLREIPQTVSVITQEQIQDQSLTSISDTLLQTPGITVVNPSTNNYRYYSRGFQLTTVQQDGVPLEYTNNQTYTPFDIALYDHVEVLRGPSGLFTGSGQPSGTVNLVRKRPTDAFVVTGEASAGSYNFYRSMLDVSGPLNQSRTIRGRFVGSLQDNDFFYAVAHNRNALLYGAVDVDITPDTTVRFSLTYQNNKAVPFVGLPAYSNKKLLDIPRSSFMGVTWGYRPNETLNPSVDIEHRFGNNWSLRVSNEYFHQHTKWLRGNAGSSVNPATDTFSGFSAALTKYKEDQNSTDISLLGSLSIFGRTHQLAFGGNRRNEDYYYAPGSTVLIPTGPVSIHSSVYNVPEPNSFPAKSISDTETTQYGAYASGRFSITNPLTLVLGGRLSWYDSTANTLYPTGKLPVKTHESAVFTPYTALVYDLNENLSAYGSYTNIFQPQSLQTVDGSLLSPINGGQYEAGVKGEFLGKQLQPSVAFFLIKQTNTPQADLANPGSYLSSGGEIQSKGIDAQLTGRPLSGWNVTLGYTYNETKYTKDATYQGQPYSTFTPRHMLKLWSDYDFKTGHLKDWSLGAGLYAASSFGTNGFTQGGYATLNANIAYRITERLHAGVNLNNITDAKYYQTLDGYDQYNNIYGAPFNGTFTLRATF